MQLIYSYHDFLGPVGRVITATEAYGVKRPSPSHRPFVGMCMVSSIDGSTVVEDLVNGNSAALSSAADREVLFALRAHADIVVVGAGTVRDEGYGVPRKAGQRVAVVSRTGNVDASAPLFTSRAGFLVMPENAPAHSIETLRAGVDDVDLELILRQLNASFVQLEGGSVLNAAMVAADLVDEVNLTVSPQVTGGVGPRLTTNAPDLAHRFRLQHVLEDEGFLFLRYLRDR